MRVSAQAWEENVSCPPTKCPRLHVLNFGCLLNFDNNVSNVQSCKAKFILKEVLTISVDGA